ncbi:ribose-5-phosphate isomerase [Cimex lectularius]|uniref:ribose-5-phosphate isomerase n=1 Tax=Cimex lectularius TaxID=79782 RepID=A0A8I6RC89_CIMLE|nr:ribose-5-phosphate isomerase [Cimex lectularius]
MIIRRAVPFLKYRSLVCRTMSNLDLAKKKAAYQAVDDFVQDGTKLGVGSGSTIVYAVERLVQKVKDEGIKVVCVPTSFQAHQLIVQNNLVLGSLETYPELDVAIDGADEVDEKFTLIKGGGGCQTQEKIVASCAKRMVVVGDYTKNSMKLGEQYKKGIPIEVIPLAHVPVARKLEKKFGGKTELRMAKMKMGPVVTDNGNFIIDWHFPDGNTDWEKVNKEITLFPGVVETGLFVEMADIAYFGQADGTVKIRKK